MGIEHCFVTLRVSKATERGGGVVILNYFFAFIILGLMLIKNDDKLKRHSRQPTIETKNVPDTLFHSHY